MFVTILEKETNIANEIEDFRLKIEDGRWVMGIKVTEFYDIKGRNPGIFR